MKTKVDIEKERSEERREKGRRRQLELRKEEKAIPHFENGEKPSKLPRVPTTMKEAKLHLSGRHTHLFRDPITREERRAWDKLWKLKGAGWNKPTVKGERYK